MKPAKYLHILQAMRKGDVVYFAETKAKTRMDRALRCTALQHNMNIRTANFVAVNSDPATAHRVLRVRKIR